jgi:anti-sigma-K factor RskA
MDRNTLLDLIPAYALGALDPEERSEVEALLATDAEAQAMLVEYQAMTEALVLTTPVRPASARLSGDLRARLAAQRAQSQPEPADISPFQLVRPIPGPRPPPSRWMPYVAGAAAMILILITALAYFMRQGMPPSDPAERYQWIVSQADARRVAFKSDLDPNTTGELVVTADGQYGVIQVEKLPNIAADRAFELWYINDTGPHSAGLLDINNPQAPNYINLPEPVEQYNAYAVSVEPETGSPDPNAPSGDVAFAVEV